MFLSISVLIVINFIIPHEFQESGLNTFECATDSVIIQLDYRCDGIIHCNDTSDETLCECPPETFRGSKGYCVSSLIEYVANRHCNMDKSQLICEIECTADQFRCSTDRCIDNSKLCDGTADCDYSLDEWIPDCRLESSRAKINASKDKPCSSLQLPCYTNEPGGSSEDGYFCAYNYNECFYAHECKVDGCSNVKDCPADQFKCYGPTCLNKSELCDGKWHCEGGVDESPIACDFKSRDTIEGISRDPRVATIGVYVFSVILVSAIFWQLYQVRKHVSNQKPPVDASKKKSNESVGPEADVPITRKSSPIKVNVVKSEPKINSTKPKSGLKISPISSKLKSKINLRSKSHN